MSALAPIQRLQAQGWRGEVGTLGAPYVWAPREARAGLRRCECNDKPPLLVVRWSCFSGAPSYEVEICGEQDGQWLKLTAYSLGAEQIDAAIARVRRAWGETERIETFVPCPTCGSGFRARDVPERMREVLNERDSDHG